ncbi:MAG: tRNA threonylcarbamoyladenosine dehydratase [Planctomycetes bacterium]|nr:tRNA threonylcarbamoyladenosine dehydratase [Planctomycetota bacterium]
MTENETPWLDRTRLLLGEDALARLNRSTVCVLGLGAVGSQVVEALARSGVGGLRLVDFDRIQLSNLNRQLFALHSTLGRPKAEVAAERVRDINPAARVTAVRTFVDEESLPGLLADGPTLVVDAVDSLNPKVAIIAAASRQGIPVFSSLGAATRIDAGQVRFGRLFAARGCPLGRLVRKRLRRRGIADADAWCVYSEEPRNRQAVGAVQAEGGPEHRGRFRRTLGSLASMTGLFGLRLAHQVVLRLAGLEEPDR